MREGGGAHERSLSDVVSWSSLTDDDGDSCADSSVERIDLSDRALAMDDGAIAARVTGSSSDSADADGRSTAAFSAITRCWSCWYCWLCARGARV